MNKDAYLTVSILAFVTALILAFIPLAGAIQNASIVSSITRPVNGEKHSRTDAERIMAGQVDCPHCNLHRGNFAGVSFRNADLTGAILVRSNLRRADLTGAKLNFASIKGADLSGARGLTQAQINTACSDSETKLPQGLHAVPCT